MTVNLWDDTNNDEVVDALKDNFCHGEDLKPYADNTWTVLCDPKSKEVELDITWNPDITEGGVLISVYKFNNPRAAALSSGDPSRDLVYTFNAKGQDESGDYFEASIFCGDCKNSDGVAVKC